MDNTTTRHTTMKADNSRTSPLLEPMMTAARSSAINKKSIQFMTTLPVFVSVTLAGKVESF